MALREIGGRLADAFSRFAGFKNPDGSETIVIGDTRHGNVDATPVEVRQAHNRALRMLGSRTNRHNTTFEMKWSHVFSATTDDQQTRQLVIKLPDMTGVRAVAVRHHNMRVGAIVNNALIRVFDDIGDAIYNSIPIDDGAADSWQTVMLDGSADASAPAKSTVAVWPQVAAASTFDVPGTVLTSPVPIIADAPQYLALRTYAADNGSRAATILTMTAGPTGTLLTHGITAFRQYGVNGVASLAALDTPVYSQYIPAVSLVFYTDHEVYSICYFGGSTDNGNDDDPAEAPADGAGLGFHNRMFFESFSDGGGMRVVSANSCWDNGSTAFFLAQLASVVAGDNDYNEIAYRLRARSDDENDLDYAAGIAGDTLAAFGPYINRVKAQALIAIRLCAKYGKTCRLILDHYNNGMTGAEYEAHKVLTAWAREMAAKGYCKLNDKVARYSDESAATGTLLYPEFFEGGTGPHFNGYGHANEATKYIAAVREGR